MDIDPQAVEVTKLSLLLKVLEGENDQTIAQQLAFFQKRVLPDLGNNIKCGNSLIGPDFYEGKQMSLLDEEEMYRINAFDWEAEFPEIMEAGGFDAVIGNPPWIFTKYVDWGEDTKKYIQEAYLSARDQSGKSRARQAGKINMFATFILKGLSVLNDGGILGFIVPNNILRTTVYDTVRKRILKSFRAKRIVDLKSGAFPGVTASTVIFLIEAGLPEEGHRIEIVDNKTLGTVQDKISNYIYQEECLNNPSYVLDIFTNTTTR